MSFQQLPWVVLDEESLPISPEVWRSGPTLMSTPTERWWFTASRIIGRLEDASIDHTLVAMEIERPGCTSPCSEGINGSYRLAEEALLEILAMI